jgi:hypothetical protein
VDQFRQGLQDATGEFAEPWKPNEGDILIGVVRRYERSTTRYSKGQPVDICILEDEATGKEVGVWLMETVLRKRFHDLRPRIGERVGVKFAGMEYREHEDPYKKFVVQVDRDASSQAAEPRFVDDEPPRGLQGPPPAHPPPSHPSPDAYGFPEAPPPYSPPAAPRAPDPSSTNEARWKRKILEYRVEPWGEEAIAAAVPGVRDELAHWGEADYHVALSRLKEKGPGIFEGAAKYLGENNPIGDDLRARVEELLELGTFDTKTRMRVQEAIGTGWHEAGSWALDLLETLYSHQTTGKPPEEKSEPEPGPAPEPELEDRPDELPF